MALFTPVVLAVIGIVAIPIMATCWLMRVGLVKSLLTYAAATDIIVTGIAALTKFPT